MVLPARERTDITTDSFQEQNQQMSVLEWPAETSTVQLSHFEPEAQKVKQLGHAIFQQRQH